MPTRNLTSLKLIALPFAGAAMTMALAVSSPTRAAEAIRSEKECVRVMVDTAQAIDENPSLDGQAEKILLEVMELAKQRCKEGQFDNAKDLLELARGMVASE